MTIINDHSTRRDFVRRSQKRLVYVICTWVRVTVKDYKLFVLFKGSSICRFAPRTTTALTSFSSLVHAVVHSRPDRSNERVLQFALGASPPLLHCSS